MDGLKAVFEGGPGAQREYVWPYHALFFATDPVAMDRIGLRDRAQEDSDGRIVVRGSLIETNT